MSKNKSHKNKKPGANGGGAYSSVLDEPRVSAKTADDEAADAPVDFIAAAVGEPVEFEPDEAENALEEELEEALEYEDQEAQEGYDEEPDYDEETDEDDEVYGEAEYRPGLMDRAISVATAVLSALLMGGSLVFWFVIGGHLARSPYALADPVQMTVLLGACAFFPLAVTIVQWLMKRDSASERWMICLCVSALLTILTIIITQTAVRKIGYTINELPLTLCCAVSGCALPSMLWLLVRRLIERAGRHLEYEKSKDWETVRADVLSLTEFGGR